MTPPAPMPSHVAAPTTATPLRPIAVYGAGGHTGRFIVAELRRRGLPARAIGRNLDRIPDTLPRQLASAEDPAALTRAFAGCSVIINAAGPFLDTATAITEAAIATGCHYVDVTAEQASAAATLDRYDAGARDAGVAVLPAVGFYGGLADLLATAVRGKQRPHTITTAIALDRWWPTAGTRRTGERNRVPRWRISKGNPIVIASPTATSTWEFPAPHGTQDMIELPFSEIPLLAHHHRAEEIRSWFASAALADLRDPATPAPVAVDADGRSAQKFAMEVVVTDDRGRHCARASGVDIYAVSAPIAVEAAERLRSGRHRCSGALSLGDAFDALDFLAKLSPTHLSVEFDTDERTHPPGDLR